MFRLLSAVCTLTITASALSARTPPQRLRAFAKAHAQNATADPLMVWPRKNSVSRSLRLVLGTPAKSTILTSALYAASQPFIDFHMPSAPVEDANCGLRSSAGTAALRIRSYAIGIVSS